MTSLALVDGIQRRAVTPATAPQTVRVLIADGQGLVRAGLRALLTEERRIAVVGEASTGEEAVTLAGRIGPDVVVIDAALPGLDSVEATRRICAQSGPAVIVLTATDDDDVILAVLRAGASAVLMKDRPAELIYAIESAARGEALLSPRVARRLIAEFVARPEPVSPDPELVDELTAREREVVQLVALGLSNDQIAERLVITRGTAKTHVSRAMVKVRAHDRAKLVVFAYEAGLALPRVQACGAA